MNNKPVRSQQPPAIKLDQLVYVELESSNGGMMLTISEEGFTFRAVTPVRPTGRIPFSFIINGTEKLEGFGKIEWTEDDGKVGGLHFADVSTEFINALRKWLAQLSASGPPSFAEARSDRSNLGQPDFAATPQLSPFEPRADNAKAPQLPDLPVIQSKLGASFQSGEAQNGNGVAAAASHDVPLVGIPKSVPAHNSWSYPSVLQEPAPSRVHGMTVAAVAIIFLMLAVLLYAYRGGVGQSLISVGQKLSGASESSESQQPKTPEGPKPAAETSQAPAPTSPAPASPSKPPEPVATQSAPASNSNDRVENGSAVKPDSAFTDARPGVSSKETVPDSGDPADQVRALWSAVEQGNTSAEVTLARLYLIGGGVPKSCDQAKVLLQAAARKGNGEAIDKLSQISQQGCP